MRQAFLAAGESVRVHISRPACACIGVCTCVWEFEVDFLVGHWIP